MISPSSEPRTSTTRTVGLPEVVRALVRGAPLAIVAVLIAAVLSILVTRSLPPTYEASASLLASRPPASFGTLDIITPPQVDPRVYQRALLDGPVIHDALLRLDGVDRSESEMIAFKRKVSVSVENQDISAVIRIAVRDTDATTAADYANAIADALIEWDRGRARLMVDNTIAALERSVAEIDAEIARVVGNGDTASQAQQALAATLREQRVQELEAARTRGASAVMVGLLETLSRAQPPVEAVGPRLVFNTFVAVVIAGLLAYGLQLAFWSVSDEVGTRARLAEVAGAPVLAVLSRRRGSRRLSGEALSYFRANLMRALKSVDKAVVGLTSPTDFTDKAEVAAALAESLARSGYRAIVLDADLRQRGPGLGPGYKVPGNPGLEAYLRDPDLPLRTQIVRIDQRVTFELLLSGASVGQANELLEYGLERLLKRLGEAYDVVIVDLPPVLAYADALVAAPVCSGVVLCTDARRSSESVRQSLELLEHAGSRVLGTVLMGTGALGRRPRVGRATERRPVVRPTEVEPPPAAPKPRAVARVKQRGS